MEITHEKLIELAQDLKDASKLEYDSKMFYDIKVAILESTKAKISVAAQDDGMFDGLKVAQAAQLEAKIISENIEVKNAMEVVLVAQNAYEAAKRQRIFHQNVIALTKAFLYSQSGMK